MTQSCNLKKIPYFFNILFVDTIDSLTRYMHLMFVHTKNQEQRDNSIPNTVELFALKSVYFTLELLEMEQLCRLLNIKLPVDFSQRLSRPTKW